MSLPLSRRLVLLLALTCASAVGNLYFPQALVPLMADAFATSTGTAATVVPATQLGYTLGLFLLVPLSDRLPGRPLLVSLLAATGVALTAAACAPTFAALLLAAVVIGMLTVGAQIIGPMMTRLIPSDQHGVFLGALLSGSTGGMLLSRVGAGALGGQLGWQAMYLVAGMVSVVLAVTVRYTLPSSAPATRQPYRSLITEMLPLVRTEPDLRRSCFYQAMVFGGFSAVWTCLGLQVGAPVAGALALVGAVTMVGVPAAGRMVDRYGAEPVTLVCLLGALLAAAVLTAGNTAGRVGLIAILVGILLLDVAMQCGMVANHARIYALRSDARGRLNTVYMTCAYLGGTIGSLLGARAWDRAGWWGVCGLLTAMSTLAVVRHLAWISRPHRASPPSGRAATELEPVSGSHT